MKSLLPESPVWTEHLRIRSYDVDFCRGASVASLCRHFLDAAWNHAEALGAGFSHLASQNKFWVLSRVRVEMQCSPAWGSALILRTWPRSGKSVFAMRDFEITDSATEMRIAAGSSAWLVLDSASKRPQRWDKLLPGLVGLSANMALDQDPGKLPDVQTWDESYSTTVRYTDIDVNQHATAGRYVSWILDAYPVDFHREHKLRSLEANYLDETLAGEELVVRTRRTEPGWYSHGLVKAGGKEVCRARLNWEQKDPA